MTTRSRTSHSSESRERYGFRNALWAVAVLALIIAAPAARLEPEPHSRAVGRSESPPVHPRFDLSSPEAALTRSPFPSDRLTVDDADQLTGRRVALPIPADCVANASDCQDIAFLDRLDGFSLTPRITVPFDGDIDVTSVGSKSVFLIPLGGTGGGRIGITQTVWDPATRTLLVSPDTPLEEHSRYALVVTRALRRHRRSSNRAERGIPPLRGSGGST